MRRPQFSVKSLLWLTAVVAAFCAGTRFDSFLDEHRTDPNETKIWVALDETADLDLVEQPLSDVIDYLKQRHAVEIQLDYKAINDAGIGSDVPITRFVKGVTLRSALKLLLSDLDMTYVIHHGVLTVTTEAEATRYHWFGRATLWLMGVVAAFLCGIQCGRAWLQRRLAIPADTIVAD